MASTPLNKTASTHRSTLVRGKHQFHIVGYSERKALAGVSARNTSVVRSGDFEAGGCTWAFSCRFRKQGLASISLELVCGKYAATAMASLRMDDPFHRWPAAVWRSPGTNTFPASPATTSRSWKLSVPEAFFHGQEERYVVDDRLTILCVVHVLRLDVTLPNTRSCFISAVPPPTISGDLLMLLFASMSKSDSVKHAMRPDVTFIVEQTEIRAHKLVLAVRSPVFAAEFRWHMNENIIIRVDDDDMSASTFRAMLRFIYTDELPIKPNNDRMILTSEDKHAARRYEAMVRDLLVASRRSV
ncbi:unnamed protein product [Triticum turgidum subsp. durum]|uniref:BTB domain-containing protein n=1 Tax=Triticum turgidum subsp. durum TaxID=4567 RepID=A0A9R0RAG6_TRITD|nr:unnamed protein product [Triticum turgidum subsp. durum]